MFKLSDFMRVYRAGEPLDHGTPPAGKTFTQVEVDELIAGLKTNNEKLLSEKKEAKRLAEEAAAQQLLASQEAARKSGELEAFEKTLRGEYAPQLESKDKIIAARNERILSSEKKAIVEINNEIHGQQGKTKKAHNTNSLSIRQNLLRAICRWHEHD